MSPEQEFDLTKKVDDIHAALVGPLGIEENGLIYRVNNHGKRLTSLERWRWLIVGGGLLLGFLAELFAAARH